MKILHSTSQKKRASSGFTLIELLVVIAIIAILAAILFPVFSRARENARRSSCQSNMKQLGLGLMQYGQDYDEKMPIVAYGDYQSGTLKTWIRTVQPYVKSYNIARCPSQSKDPFDIWNGADTTGYSKQYWPSYGFNYMYLNPDGGRVVSGSLDFQPINISKIAQASSTVAFAEVKIVGSMAAGGYYSSYELEAPGTLGAGEPDEIAYDDRGWGSGMYKDGVFGEPDTYTGDLEARHFSGSNVAFVDGHVKWMTPGRLAQGTNWAVGKANTDVDITDINSYLWDYR